MSPLMRCGCYLEPAGWLQHNAIAHWGVSVPPSPFGVLKTWVPSIGPHRSKLLEPIEISLSPPTLIAPRYHLQSADVRKTTSESRRSNCTQPPLTHVARVIQVYKLPMLARHDFTHAGPLLIRTIPQPEDLPGVIHEVSIHGDTVAASFVVAEDEVNHHHQLLLINHTTGIQQLVDPKFVEVW